jgi:nucleotide-binding universal stress UspA family protein
MPIKTILTFWNGAPDAERQVQAAIAFARRFDAHLGVATIGYEPDIPADAYTSVSGVLANAELHARAEKEAGALAAEATERLATEAVRGDATPLVTTPAGLGHAFGRLARYSDLVVLARPEGDDYRDAARRTFEGALFHGEAAVIVCPRPVDASPSRAMIAWDGGPAALRAVRRAYPLLADVTELGIVLVDGSADQMRSAEDLATMLARYALPVSITPVASEERSDAEALRRHQVESGAELIVAGAYGHSRFRELLLGGVTRDLPGIADVPVFMAH